MSIKPKIDVIVDTNIIFAGRTGRNLMTQGFKDAIAKLADKAEIVVYIPEMVFEEIYFQKRFAMVGDYNAIQSAGSRIERLVPTKVILRHKLKSLERMLKRALLRDVGKSGCRLLKFALTSKRWKKIAQTLVRREPPFDKEGEAAYRDAVIRVQAHEFSKKQKAPITVFLVGDNNSRSAAEGLEDGRRFIILPSTEALTALVDDLTSKSAQRLKEVRVAAAKRFAGWKDGLFIKWNIDEKIQEHIGWGQHLRGQQLSPMISPGQFLFASELGKYPPFRRVDGTTEVISFDETGQYFFQSKVSDIYHYEAGYAAYGVTLERRQVDVSIAWSAHFEQDTFSDEKLGEIKYTSDEKSTVFVGLPIGGALGIGPTGPTGPLSLLGQSSSLSGFRGPTLDPSATGLSSLFLSASGSSGQLNALDQYAKFNP
jgi:PIN domain-containing protein